MKTSAEFPASRHDTNPDCLPPCGHISHILSVNEPIAFFPGEIHLLGNLHAQVGGPSLMTRPSPSMAKVASGRKPVMSTSRRGAISFSQHR
jgi:hypothetical protein